MTGRQLAPGEARRVYDRIGRKQDSQGFYEDAAVSELLAHADLGAAAAVLELGSGTGRWALRLLDTFLPSTAHYLGLDLSPVMLGLASRRLAGHRSRAAVACADITRGLPVAGGAVDRVLVTYVLDLLAPEAISAQLGEARRVLAPGGLLCTVGLTNGNTLPSSLVSRLWSLAFRASPALVGGCRPLELSPRLPSAEWRVLHHRVVTAWAVPSEVIVARAL